MEDFYSKQIRDKFNFHSYLSIPIWQIVNWDMFVYAKRPRHILSKKRHSVTYNHLFLWKELIVS